MLQYMGKPAKPNINESILMPTTEKTTVCGKSLPVTAIMMLFPAVSSQRRAVLSLISYVMEKMVIIIIINANTPAEKDGVRYSE